MKCLPLLSTLAILILNAPSSFAQKDFVEGVVTYTISSKASPNEPSKATGSFTLSFKDGMIRKDIKMSSGYNNSIIIHNRNSTVYSLKTLADVRYAVQMDYPEYMQRQKKFQGFSLAAQDVNESYVGYPATKATITYKDGSTALIFYSKDLQLVDAGLFERFPGIQYLPLVLDFTRDDGSALHLEVQKVEIRPVETSLFTIPTDYKIISSAELKQLTR